MDEANRIAVYVEMRVGNRLVADMNGPVSFLLPTDCFSGHCSLEESRDAIVGRLRHLADTIEKEAAGTLPQGRERVEGA